MLKHLRGIAASIVHKFSVSANHFAYMALNGENKEVVIDFLTGGIYPQEYFIERNRILVAQCKENFEYLLTPEEKQKIISAKLIAAFSRQVQKCSEI